MTIEKITMPQLGESVTEGTIVSWLVKEGDAVKKYDPIAEVLTDKVNAEVPSSFTGTIQEIVIKEGETVAVNEVLCYINTEDTKINDRKENKENNIQAEELETKPIMKNRYSPAVLKLAQENSLDLTKISGTGKGGRITRKDVERVIANKESFDSVSSPQSEEKDSIEIGMENTSYKKGNIEIPVTGIRKAIAQNMTRSKQEIPHAWMMIEVDVTDLVQYRNAIKDEFKAKEGVNLTYFAFFLKAVATALKEYPELNSTWKENKIIQHTDINLSIAVANEKELYVPVIKQADDRSIKGIAKEIERLANKARAKKLASEDMAGGTFTVNNTGSFGSISSMGIINYPQAAILQVESIVKRPVIIDGMFAARDIVNLCLSLDHRVLDGLVCGRFLQRVKEILESMNSKTCTIY